MNIIILWWILGGGIVKSQFLNNSAFFFFLKQLKALKLRIFYRLWFKINVIKSFQKHFPYYDQNQMLYYDRTTHKPNAWRKKLNDFAPSNVPLKAFKCQLLPLTQSRAPSLTVESKLPNKTLQGPSGLAHQRTTHSLRGDFSSWHNSLKASGLSRQRAPLVERLLPLLMPSSHKLINDFGDNFSGSLTWLHVYNNTPP